MIETQRWDDSLIGKPETYGYSAEFTIKGKNYYADISNRVHPVETMISVAPEVESCGKEKGFCRFGMKPTEWRL